MKIEKTIHFQFSLFSVFFFSKLHLMHLFAAYKIREKKIRWFSNSFQMPPFRCLLFFHKFFFFKATARVYSHRFVCLTYRNFKRKTKRNEWKKMKKQWKKNINVFNDDNSIVAIRRDGEKKSNSKIAFLFPHDCNKLILGNKWWSWNEKKSFLRLWSCWTVSLNFFFFAFVTINVWSKQQI